MKTFILRGVNKYESRSIILPKVKITFFDLGKYKPGRLNTDGALLMESLVAVVILAVCLTLIIQSLVNSLRAAVYGNDYSQAMLVAENQMFDVMRVQFLKTPFDQDGTLPPPLERYQYLLKSESLDPAAEGPLYKINLDLLWGTSTKRKKFSLATYFLDLSDKTNPADSPEPDVPEGEADTDEE